MLPQSCVLSSLQCVVHVYSYTYMLAITLCYLFLSRSPHLLEVRERIRLNGEPLSKDKFVTYFWECYSKLKKAEVCVCVGGRGGGGELGGGKEMVMVIITGYQHYR